MTRLNNSNVCDCVYGGTHKLPSSIYTIYICIVHYGFMHKSLNSSKGVVRNWELVRTDPAEIKENVPMITDVHRILVKRNNVEIKTNTRVLTFNTPHIPDSLKNGYLNIAVTQYVPNPIRCCKCQRFGHVTGKCKHSETCAICAETGHKDDPCTKEYKCINCGNTHAS